MSAEWNVSQRRRSTMGIISALCVGWLKVRRPLDHETEQLTLIPDLCDSQKKKKKEGARMHGGWMQHPKRGLEGAREGEQRPLWQRRNLYATLHFTTLSCMMHKMNHPFHSPHRRDSVLGGRSSPISPSMICSWISPPLLSGPPCG